MTSDTDKVIPFEEIDWDALTRQLDEEHPETAAQAEERSYTEQAQLVYDKLLLGQPVTLMVPSSYYLRRLRIRICQLKKRSKDYHNSLIGGAQHHILQAKPIQQSWSDTMGGPVVFEFVARKTPPTFTILE